MRQILTLVLILAASAGGIWVIDLFAKGCESIARQERHRNKICAEKCDPYLLGYSDADGTCVCNMARKKIQ